MKLPAAANWAQILGTALAIVTATGTGVVWYLRRRARHAPAPAAPVASPSAMSALSALPVVNVAGFLGRGEELADITQLEQNGKRVIWVAGLPQSGKSWTISQWIRNHELQRRARRFELRRGVELPALLEGINAFLCAHGETGFDAACGSPSSSPADKVGPLITVLNRRRWTFVLDSFEQVADAADFRYAVGEMQRSLTNSLLLIGTRLLPDWADRKAEVKIGAIGPENAGMLLRNAGAPEGALHQLNRAVGGLPGALELAGALAQDIGAKTVVNDIRGAAEHVGEKLLGRTFDAAGDGAKRLWTGFCLLPAPVTRETAQAMCQGQDFDGAWSELVRRKLLEPGAERAGLHPLARVVGRARLDTMPDWSQQCQQHIARFYAASAGTIGAGRAVLEAELENLLAAAHLAYESQEWEALWQMGYELDDPLDFAGRWTAREVLLRLCHQGARVAADRQSEAAFAHNLAVLHQDRGHTGEAEQLYQQSLEIKREVGDRPGEARTLHQLGMVAQDQGQLEDAEQLYQQSLEVRREVGDRPGEARTLHQLGTVAQDRGRLGEAEQLYQQSLEIKREVGDRLGEAATLHALGMVAQGRGRLEEAEWLSRQSLDVRREVGDRPGEATALAQMALLAEQLGNLPLAIRRTQQALAMLEEMGMAGKEQAREQLARLMDRLAGEGSG